MNKRLVRSVLVSGIVAAGAAAPAAADVFQRQATWPVYRNLPQGEASTTETAAEILAASADGRALVYTDSELGVLGKVDIGGPNKPRAAGRINLDGEPTSVAVVDGFALAGVNTSESFVSPSGHVAVVDLAAGTVVARCDVKGQPDSVAVSPNRTFLAVAVENERDEDLNDGAIPQLPAGHLAILDLGPDGRPTNCDGARIVDLTGLADVAPGDPEPEYVSINGADHAVVTLQENNHIVIVDLKAGTVASHFSAGTVDLIDIDSERDKVIRLTGSLDDVPREPDAVAWLDDDRFVTANEGDLAGGSRGFSIFNRDGTVLYDSGAALEHLAARLGHYPEKRAGKKGNEPEGVAVGTYGDERLIFIGSERANFIAVYRDEPVGPILLQVLPVGVGPEGILPIPARNLVAVASEVDSAEDGVRSTIAVFARIDAAPAYPDIVSELDAAKGGVPITWGALSGLAGDPNDGSLVYAVHDNFYGDSRIYTVDVSARPARIVEERQLKKDGAPVAYDLEGISVASDGGFWLVSEGDPGKGVANLLVKVAADGTVEREIELPETIAGRAVRFGFEGVAEVGEGANARVYVAVQRTWNDDPRNHARIAVYDPASESWGFLFYPLDEPESPAGGWVGLSEIVAVKGSKLAILERDNKGGPDAAIKRVYLVDVAAVTPAGPDAVPPVVEKSLAIDMLPAMQAKAGWVPDKPEGLTITADGTVSMVTDNDGVDDASGETMLIRLGTADEVFGGQ